MSLHNKTAFPFLKAKIRMLFFPRAYLFIFVFVFFSAPPISCVEIPQMLVKSYFNFRSIQIKY